MVLTQESGGGEGRPLKVSETIVRNLRVLATDQRIDSKDEEGNTVVSRPSDRHHRSHSAHRREDRGRAKLGTLSLSLRSIADDVGAGAGRRSGEVKVPQGTSPADERRLLNSWANRPIDTNTTYTTGGDVSRFQRRTVPAKSASSAPGDSLANFARADGREPAAQSQAAPAVSGPVVRVARGNSVTVVPVGAR
jgi:pilus assembly protein CpaB